MQKKTTSSISTIRIRQQDIPVETLILEQRKLRFFPDNPRIYSLLRADEREPRQEEIERKLLDLEHVRELIRDIRRDGGLIDPLIVRGGSLEVLEGNSRLAAYRKLAQEDPIKWGHVKCTVLPSDTDEKLIFALLGQYHIKGKKNWVPYEQAGFLYRRYKVHQIDVDTLAAEIGLAKATVRILIDTYEFMRNAGEIDTDRWSYYYEYLKSRKIKKAREGYPGFNDLIVTKSRAGEIATATDGRARLPVIWEASPTVLRKFAKGEIDFEEAHEAALEAGGEDEFFRRLKKFRTWLAKDEVGETLCGASGQLRHRVDYEVTKLANRVLQLQKRLKNLE